MKRKLTTIFCADVAGYSRMMGMDEARTLATLKEYREAIEGFIERHHGRVVSWSGDGLLAEFAWPTIADTYFTPELAARFKKALEAEEPVIDWDFFINGQDYGELKVMSVETATIDAVKAEVRITTSNFGNLSVTAISLVNGEAGWKIADFAFLENGAASSTLSGILKESGY